MIVVTISTSSLKIIEIDSKSILQTIHRYNKDQQYCYNWYKVADDNEMKQIIDFSQMVFTKPTIIFTITNNKIIYVLGNLEIEK